MVKGVLKNNVEFLVHTAQQLAVAVRASGGVDIPVPQGG
jgi:hypothetical protein